MPSTRRLPRTAPILVLLTAAGAAQQVPEAPGPRGAYGIAPEVLASGELPPGWVSFDGSLASLDPRVAARPLAPCSTDVDPDDGVWTNAPWPGGVVPYEFDANMTATMQSQALAAFAVLQALENDVTFVPRMGEGDYIHMQDDTVNQSPVGHGGMLTVRIVNWGVQGIIVHELLHALGLYHEQGRSDRDSYVQVFPSNIQSGRSHNFDIQGGAYYQGPYDFGSIMQYGVCAWSICSPCTSGCETILPQPAYASFQSIMGQRTAMSPLDVHNVNALYPQPLWRFVAWNTSVGSGTGTDPWQEVSSALSSAPSGTRLFVMPRIYTAATVRTMPMTIEAPVGGVVIR